MNFYLLDDPAEPGEYASFSQTGTWMDDRLCPVCQCPFSELVEPLRIEWDRGTDQIGDFSWCGYTCVVIDPVRDILQANGFECTFGKVRVERPRESTRVKRVPYPYTGPHLNWLIPSTYVSLEENKSRLRLEIDCAECGRQNFSFKREKLVIQAREWNNSPLFRLTQFKRSSATYLSEAGLSVLKSHQFSNICPREAGRIVSD